MRVNSKELWIFVGCLAVVTTTHSELLVRLPEWGKDLVTLVALAVIAMQQKILSEKEYHD